MSISSLQAKAFIAGLPNSAKQEILNELMNDISKSNGEPIYTWEGSYNKTSRQIVQESCYSCYLRDIKYNYFDFRRLHHSAALVAHYIVAALIENNDYKGYLIPELIVDTLEGRFSSDGLRNVFEIIYNTSCLRCCHEYIRLLEQEYQFFHSFRNNLDRRLTRNDIPLNCDKLYQWALGNDFTSQLRYYFENLFV